MSSFRIIRRPVGESNFPWTKLGGGILGFLSVVCAMLFAIDFYMGVWDEGSVEFAVGALITGSWAYSLLSKAHRARNSPAALYREDSITIYPRRNPGPYAADKTISLKKISLFEVAAPGLVELYFRGPLYDEAGVLFDADAEQSHTLEGEVAGVEEFLGILRRLGVRGR